MITTDNQVEYNHVWIIKFKSGKEFICKTCYKTLGDLIELLSLSRKDRLEGFILQVKPVNYSICGEYEIESTDIFLSSIESVSYPKNKEEK